MGFCQSVPNDQIYVVEKCGKFNGIHAGGLLCLPVPGVWVVAGRISTRIQQLDVNVETKTKDNVFVTLVISVQHVIQPDKVYEAHYSLTDLSSQLSSYVFDVVRSEVPKMLLDEVFESKDDIAQAVKAQLKVTMDAFGISVVRTLVTDINPDAKVKNAMNEINASKRQRLAMQEKAEAEKILTVKAAEADAEAKYLQGDGVARQRKAIAEGLKESVNQFSDSVGGELDTKEVLDLVLITQYFDMLKDLGENSANQQIFVPHNPGSLAHLADEIRRGVLVDHAEIQKKVSQSSMATSRSSATSSMFKK